jgi:hypothetical protein
MEEVYFPCGAILTASHIDRWQASKILFKGCGAKEQTHHLAGMLLCTEKMLDCC